MGFIAKHVGGRPRIATSRYEVDRASLYRSEMVGDAEASEDDINLAARAEGGAMEEKMDILRIMGSTRSNAHPCHYKITPEDTTISIRGH